MSTITISKKEYKELVENKFRYEHLRQAMEEDIFAPPPVKNIKDITLVFRKSGVYSKKFIDSLNKGLSRSLYFKK